MKSAVAADPPTVNFGEINRSTDGVTSKVILTRGDGGPINPRVLNTGSPQITAEVQELEAGERYELAVTAKPPFQGGMVRGSVVVETGVEKSPQETITVFGRIAPRVQANPNRFSIPQEVNSDLEVPTNIVWSDNQPGKITDVNTSDPQLTVELREQDNRQVVVLKVPKGYQIGQGQRNSVNIRTDDKETPLLQLPIFAMPKPMARQATTRPTTAAPPTIQIRKEDMPPRPQTPTAGPGGH